VIEVIQCTGRKRNDSGLAMIVKIGGVGGQGDILLPGDSKYRYIAGLSAFNLFGLVASHHGGHLGKKPQIPTTKNGLNAYSYGFRNTFNHRSKMMERAYIRSGWKNARKTPKGSIAVERSKITPLLSCGGTKCDLRIGQVF
jgi:hypothetical protein